MLEKCNTFKCLNDLKAFLTPLSKSESETFLSVIAALCLPVSWWFGWLVDTYDEYFAQTTTLPENCPVMKTKH